MHNLKEDNRKQEQQREELMIRQYLQHWLFVRTAENGIFTILFVALVVTTEVN